MNQALVSLENGIPSTTSLKVSEVFHKRHDAVIRDIRKLQDNTPESFHAHNFVEMVHEVQIGSGAIRQATMYTMTRDGFTLLVMGYTGKEAMRFKLEYIEAFNAMEKELMRRQNSSLPPADRSDLKALVDAKLSICPAHMQGKARSELWARFNRHFRIAEYAQLPQAKMAEARDYIIMLELNALRAVETRKAAALPAAPASAVSKQEKTVIMLKEVMDMVKDAYHPGVISLAMTPEKRTRYYQRHSLYCSATDCLLAACRILETEKELAGEAYEALPAPRSRGLKGDMKELKALQSKLDMLMQTVQINGLRGYSTGDDKAELNLVQSRNAHIRTAVNCLIMAKLALSAATA